MAKQLLPDELWEICETILPRLKRSKKGGRPPVGNREALTGILFVLKTGIAWEDLPQEMGCGSGMTCWRRLVAWQKAGVWDKLHDLLLEQLQRADQIDWSRAIVDSASLKAVMGGKNRSESHGSQQVWQQAPYNHRRQRHPLGHRFDGRQHP